MATYLETGACRTALGDAGATIAALLAGQQGVRPQPVLGPDGGEDVPLALVSPMASTVPPRWWSHLIDLLGEIPPGEWGSPRCPVILTSSNFGIDGLYALGRDHGNTAHTAWATAGHYLDHLREALGWGPHVSIFSHACVSAHLAFVQAQNLLESGLAERVLLVSFDYVGPFVAGGFHALKILNEGLPAPYADRETGSIGLGDGAAWAILSTSESPWKIAGLSTFNEMHHFTSNEPTGSGFRAVLEPLHKLLGGQRFWIKGHGTGTLEAGRLEATTLAESLPAAPLVSWKGSLGHTLGSCALVETILAITARQGGRIPGTVGTSGPTFTEHVATDAFPAAPFDSILLLANAFGGAHGALVLSHA